MAIFYRNQIVTGPGVLTLAGSIDSIYITARGGQTSTNADAIVGVGSNHVVTVYGFVDGELSGMRLGDDVNQDSNQTVHIGTSGDVYGRVDGIHIDAHDSNVRNDGVVFGRETGIELNAGIGTSRLVNSGTILSDTEGVRSTGAQTLIIENTGTIFGQTRAIATFGGTTAIITNTGEIVGQIYLDSGNDIYNGTNGRVSGHISCFGGNDTVYAGIDNDYIEGMGGNDILNGGLGADRMIGGSGDDTFYVDNIGDAIVEAGGEGNDIAAMTISYRLAAGVSVERMNTTSQGGTSDINLTGNEFVQTLIGNSGNNRLEGREGNDTLHGLGGKDTFVFNTKLGATNVDTIADFNVADDRFLLSDAVFQALTPGSLPVAAFRANATGLAQDSSDHIIYETDTGKLFYDKDGLGGAAGAQFAKMAVGLGLTQADFLIA